MDFLKLIQSLQDLVYEMVIWVLFLPKTLLRAIFRPDLMVKYVNEEWKKEPENQFDDYLSPTLFMLIAGVLPATYLTWFSTEDDAVSQFTESNLLTSILAMLAGFLIYLSLLEWLNKRKLKRTTLKRLFLIQCYLLTPAHLIYVLLLFVSGNSDVNYGITTLGVLIQAFYETFAFKDELKTNWLKGFLYAVSPYLALFLLTLIVSILLLVFSDFNLGDYIFSLSN